MGIGGITSSTGSMSVKQVTAADLKDQKSKNIQNEITNVQQQIRQLSSAEDLPAHEIANERKKLQQEVSGLNTELRQHQDELRRSKKRELMMEELLEEKKPAEEQKTEDTLRPEEAAADPADSGKQPADNPQAAQPGTVISSNSDGIVLFKESPEQNKTAGMSTEKEEANAPKEEAAAEENTKTAENDTAADDNASAREMHARVSADVFLQQADYQGTVIARSRDGIAILKSEIKLDEDRDTDTERKQAQLEKMEKQNQRETEFQFSLLGDAGSAMKSAADPNGSAKGRPAADAGNTFYVSGLHASQEEQAERTGDPKFYVSIT